MKQSLYVILGSILSLIGQSCHVEDVIPLEIGELCSNHCVNEYRIANDFKVSAVPNQSVFAVKIVFSGDSLVYMVAPSRPKFDSLVAYYGDTSNKRFTWIPPRTSKALSAPISSVQVAADKDYDDRHKAGASLENLVRFCAVSPFAYIRNGHVPTHSPKDYPALWTFMEFPYVNREQYGPVNLLASEVNEHNTHLLFPTCYLLFTQPPQAPGEYTFTITIRWDNKTVSHQVTHTF